MSFRQFIKGKRFQSLKDEAIELANHQCGQCGCKYNLQAFIKSYTDIKKLTAYDLIILCENHGHEFTSGKKKTVRRPYWVNKQDIEEVSNRYVRQIFRNGGLKNPPKELVLAKREHLKIKRYLNETKS